MATQDLVLSGTYQRTESDGTETPVPYSITFSNLNNGNIAITTRQDGEVYEGPNKTPLDDVVSEARLMLEYLGEPEGWEKALNAWLESDDVAVEGEDTSCLKFSVVDQADNLLGTVIVQLTGKSSIIDLWAEDAQGDIVGAPQPMRLNADSLGRQMPACFYLLGVTDQTEVANRVAEAAQWVTTATGGYTRTYDIAAGEDVVHVIAYDDGAQTAIPLYLYEDGEAYVRQGEVKKPKNVSFETDTAKDSDGYKRVIVARTGGLTHFIRFKAA